MSITKEFAKDCHKKYMRIKRHGDENFVMKRGRKNKSASHKKATYQKRLEKKKQEKIDDGTYRPRGRPKKEEVVCIIVV